MRRKKIKDNVTCRSGSSKAFLVSSYSFCTVSSTLLMKLTNNTKANTRELTAPKRKTKSPIDAKWWNVKGASDQSSVWEINDLVGIFAI